MFSRSRNPLLTFLLSYHVWVTSKIQVNFRYRRYSKVLMILSYKFLKFLQYSCLRGQEIHCWHSYWATMFGWPRKSRSTSGKKVLMIVSYEFLKFFHYLCFRGWGIHLWYSYWATMFQWPRKSRSTSGTGGTRRYWWFCLMNFQNFFSIHVSEVKKSTVDTLTELPCLGEVKNSGQLPVQVVLMILSYGFLKFLYYLGFQGQGIHCWYSFWATSFGWPRKSESTSGSRGFWGHPNKVAQ